MNDGCNDDDNMDEKSVPESKIEARTSQTDKSNGKTGRLAKIRRPSSRLSTNIDQYSDERCLTADDELFDFSLHI